MSGKVLLADENIALGAIHALRKAGYQVIAVAEESPGLSDAEVLARGCALSAILLTFDRDYGELIFKDGHPYPRSVIFLRSFPESPEEMSGVIEALLDGSAGEVDGYFVVWTHDGIRKRLFPRHE